MRRLRKIVPLANIYFTGDSRPTVRSRPVQMTVAGRWRPERAIRISLWRRHAADFAKVIDKRLEFGPRFVLVKFYLNRVTRNSDNVIIEFCKKPVTVRDVVHEFSQPAPIRRYASMQNSGRSILSRAVSSSSIRWFSSVRGMPLFSDPSYSHRTTVSHGVAGFASSFGITGTYVQRIGIPSFNVLTMRPSFAELWVIAELCVLGGNVGRTVRLSTYRSVASSVSAQSLMSGTTQRATNSKTSSYVPVTIFQVLGEGSALSPNTG